MFEAIERLSAKQISVDFGGKLTLSEHQGIELLCKVNRLFYEIDNIKFSKNRVERISLSTYNGIPFGCDIGDNKIAIHSGSITEVVSFDKVGDIKNKIYSFLDRFYGLGGICFKNINPMFLEQMLGVDLPYLLSANIDETYLSDLRNFDLDNPDGILIKDGRYYKQISRNEYINIPNHINNFIGQTNQERTESVLEAMKNHQYGKTNELIVLYNDSPIIRDGEHRAAALFYLYGNVKLKVLRLKFSRNFYSYKLYYKECQ